MAIFSRKNEVTKSAEQTEEEKGVSAKDKLRIVGTSGFQDLLVRKFKGDAEQIANFDLEGEQGTELIESYAKSEKSRGVVVQNVKARIEARGLSLDSAALDKIKSEIDASFNEKIEAGDYAAIESLEAAIAEQEKLQQEFKALSSEFEKFKRQQKLTRGTSELASNRDAIEKAYPNRGKWFAKLRGSNGSTEDMRKKADKLSGGTGNTAAMLKIADIEKKLAAYENTEEKLKELKDSMDEAMESVMAEQMISTKLNGIIEQEAKTQFEDFVDASKRDAKTLPELIASIKKFGKFSSLQDGAESMVGITDMEQFDTEVTETLTAKVVAEIVQAVETKTTSTAVALELKKLLKSPDLGIEDKEETLAIIDKASKEALKNIATSGVDAPEKTARLKIALYEIAQA